MIRRATLKDLEQLAGLFDGYRQFYEQPSDVALAQGYLQQRLERDESVIFVAEADDATLLGFCQLYPTFCSVAAQPIIVLYDLFVSPDVRRTGAGKALMLAAQAYGAEQGVSRLELATAIDNLPGQALYESLGWERDTDFYHYEFEIDA